MFRVSKIFYFLAFYVELQKEPAFWCKVSQAEWLKNTTLLVWFLDSISTILVRLATIGVGKGL